MESSLSPWRTTRPLGASWHPATLALAGLCAATAWGPWLGTATAGSSADSAAVLSATLETDANTRYLWRGIAYSEQAVLQPSVSASYSNLTLGAWCNIERFRAESSGLNEVDLTLAYEGSRGRFTFQPSALAYFYPNEASAATGEIEAQCSAALDHGVRLFVRHTMDTSAYRGANFSAVGFTVENGMPHAWSLTSSAQAGRGSRRFVRTYLGEPANAIAVFNGTLAATWSGPRGAYVRPHLDFCAVPNTALRSQAGNPPFVTFGIALGREF